MENTLNNNYGFYKDLDTNFSIACSLCEQNFTHDELLFMLKNGNIPEKQIAALKFDIINNTNDAVTLINNLTGCDGKIREAVALKINTLITENKTNNKVIAEVCAKQFADATVDINANICRLIIDSAVMLKDYSNFAIDYTHLILNKTNEAMQELDKFIFKDKKYVINKQLFKLYWCLEALSEFYMYANNTILKNILEKCAIRQEYTIREKTAQIIVNSGKYKNIKDKLINDENYYVRQVFLHHPCLF